MHQLQCIGIPPNQEMIWNQGGQITIRRLYARWLWRMGPISDQVWPHLQIIQIVLSSQWIPLSLRWVSICSSNEFASEQYNSYWYSQNTVDFTINWHQHNTNTIEVTKNALSIPWISNKTIHECSVFRMNTIVSTMNQHQIHTPTQYK